MHTHTHIYRRNEQSNKTRRRNKSSINKDEWNHKYRNIEEMAYSVQRCAKEKPLMLLLLFRILCFLANDDVIQCNDSKWV